MKIFSIIQLLLLLAYGLNYYYEENYSNYNGEKVVKWDAKVKPVKVKDNDDSLSIEAVLVSIKHVHPGVLGILDSPSIIIDNDEDVWAKFRVVSDKSTLYKKNSYIQYKVKYRLLKVIEKPVVRLKIKNGVCYSLTIV